MAGSGRVKTMPRWTHDTSILLPAGPEDGEDQVEIEVRLHLSGILGSPPVINYNEFDHPGWSREVEIERFEILDRGKWRKPVEADFAGPNDTAIIDAVGEWLSNESNFNACFETLFEMVSYGYQ